LGNDGLLHRQFVLERGDIFARNRPDGLVQMISDLFHLAWPPLYKESIA